MKKVDSPIRPLFPSEMHTLSLSNTCLENARKLNLSRYYLAINHFDYYSKNVIYSSTPTLKTNRLPS